MTDRREDEIVADPEKLREHEAQRGAAHDDPHQVIEPQQILRSLRRDRENRPGADSDGPPGDG